MVKKKKVILKKPITKGALVAQIKEQQEKLEWANKIIRLQQGEVDRLMKLNDTLTDTLNRFSRKD